MRFQSECFVHGISFSFRAVQCSVDELSAHSLFMFQLHELKPRISEA